MKEFFDKNKVFLIGLAGAVLIGLQQYASETAVDWKIVGLGVGIAAISYIARNWRGQGMSIIGIAGNIGFAFMTVYETGHFNWSQFFIQLTLTFGFAAMPDQKSRGYEHAREIVKAKVEGETIVPAAGTNTQIKKEALSLMKARSTRL